MCGREKSGLALASSAIWACYALFKYFGFFAENLNLLGAKFWLDDASNHAQYNLARWNQLLYFPNVELHD